MDGGVDFGKSLTDRLGRFLTDEVDRTSDLRNLFWFGLSLAFSIAFAARALQQAFGGSYVLQDDWRQHVFWMARFLDPDVFPRDLIADYFQAVAPTGYAAFYHVVARLGLDPVSFARILPMVLGLTTTAFCFAVSMQILRVPAAAFFASLLLNQSLWMRNGLVSATPRAFISPLFLAFMYFLLRRSLLLTLLSIALMGLFFPSIMFVGIGVLFVQLVRWENRRVYLSRDRRDYLLCAAAVMIAIAVLLPYGMGTAGFGPVVTASEARSMPEFLPGGRIVVFRQGFWDYWIAGNHTGMFSSAVFSPIAMCLGVLLPVLMIFPNRFPLVSRMSRVSVFPKIIAASLVMFFAANILLFRLYLPSRFTVNSFRVLLALGAGISAIVLLDAVLLWVRRSLSGVSRSLIAVCAVGLLAAMLAMPFVKGTVVDTRYKIGTNPRLYEFLASQPKDIVVASLSNEAESLPTFARRSIFVGREIALPYHKTYYSQIRERAIDLINAQYSPSIADLQSFIRKYGIDYLLIDRDAFTPQYIANDKWVRQFQPAAADALALLRQGSTPALSRLADNCPVLSGDEVILVSAECVLNSNEDPIKRNESPNAPAQ